MLKHRDAIFGAALAMAALYGTAKKRRPQAAPKEQVEIERWNAEVEAKRAAKKARKLAGKGSGNGQ